MRRSRLEVCPNYSTYRLCIEQLPIPEAPRKNIPLIAKEGVTFVIIASLFGKTMATAIKLDVVTCFRTIEIEIVRSDLVLAAEFVFREAPVPQNSPKLLLGPRSIMAQQTSDICRHTAASCALLASATLSQIKVSNL